MPTACEIRRQTPRLWGQSCLDDGLQQVADKLAGDGAAVFGFSGELTGMQMSVCAPVRPRAGQPAGAVVTVACGSKGGTGRLTLDADLQVVARTLNLLADDALAAWLLLRELNGHLAGHQLPHKPLLHHPDGGYHVQLLEGLMVSAVAVRHFLFAARPGEPPAMPSRYPGWAFVGARTARKGGAYWLSVGGPVDPNYTRSKLNLPHPQVDAACRALNRVRLS